MPKISAIMTAHKEGYYSVAAARSMLRAVDQSGLDCEIIVILDNADDLTTSILKGVFKKRARYFKTKTGDPGQSRNAGVDKAKGEFVTFLDADDLWSSNWITEAYNLVKNDPKQIAHSEVNYVFGDEINLWWHVDQLSGAFNQDYLDHGNYWDSMAFAHREVYYSTPFRKNMKSEGYGHEDWDWNRRTVAKGYVHRPAQDTMHFKRRRAGSIMAQVAQADSIVHW